MDTNYSEIYKILDHGVDSDELVRLEAQLEQDIAEWGQNDTWPGLFTRCVELGLEEVEELTDDDALLYGMLDFVCALLLVKTAQRRKEAIEMNEWLSGN